MTKDIGTDHTQRAHSQLGASSSHRWMECTASVSLIEALNIESETSAYAEEGTAAHELAEHCLITDSDKNEDLDPREFIGSKTTFNGFEVTENMAEAVKVYVDYIRSKVGDFTEVLVEEKFDLAYIDVDMFGTNDCCIIDEGESLEIVDYKHGMGVDVPAKDNPQLLYYALGAYRKFNLEGYIKKVILTIVQPRIFNGKPIKTWTIDEEDLLKFEKKLIETVTKIRNNDVEYVTGEHCRFCPVKAHCPKRKEEAMKVLGLDIVKEEVKLELADPETLPLDQIQAILGKGERIKDWIDSVFDFAKNEIMKGNSVPGYKAVESRTNRKYRNEDEVVEAFEETYGDKIFQIKKSLIPIGKMEKLVGKNKLAEFLIKPEGYPIVVHESDKRPAMKTTKNVLFDEKEDDLDLDF